MLHVLIGLSDGRHARIALAYVAKQTVVEPNDVGRAAEVSGLGLALLDGRLIDITLEINPYPLAENRRVGIAEAVNRLLGVADEHIEIAIGQALLEQAAEVLILLSTRVLELINHEVGNS